MKFYLFDENVIIASNTQQEAESLYIEDYECDEYEIEEINDDYVVDSIEIIGCNISGYDQIHLFQVLEDDKKLPYIVADITLD